MFLTLPKNIYMIKNVVRNRQGSSLTLLNGRTLTATLTQSLLWSSEALALMVQLAGRTGGRLRDQHSLTEHHRAEGGSGYTVTRILVHTYLEIRLIMVFTAEMLHVLKC